MGRGASGIVFEVQDAAAPAAALKLYTAAPQRASAAIARLLRDAVAAGALGHPNSRRCWPPGCTRAGLGGDGARRGREPPAGLPRALAVAHRARPRHLAAALRGPRPRAPRGGPPPRPQAGRRDGDAGRGGAAPRFRGVAPQGPRRAGAGVGRGGAALPGPRGPRRPPSRPPRRRLRVGAIVYELVARRRAFPGDTSTDVIRGISHGEPDLACLPSTVFSPGLEQCSPRSLARRARGPPPLVRGRARRARAARAGDGAAPARDDARRRVAPRARGPRHRADAGPGRRPPGGRDRVGRRLVELDGEDEWARRTVAEIESAQREREVDELVGLALSHAADGEIELAAQIAEKIERLAPWSPRYLQLQVYLDEEKARQAADRLVAGGREHLRQGRREEARRPRATRSPRCPATRARGSCSWRRTAPPAPGRRRRREVLSFDPEPRRRRLPPRTAQPSRARPDRRRRPEAGPGRPCTRRRRSGTS